MRDWMLLGIAAMNACGALLTAYTMRSGWRIGVSWGFVAIVLIAFALKIARRSTGGRDNA